MVLKYLSQGHSYKEVRKELGVGISTIKAWKRLLNETGSLEKRPRERATTKFHSEELADFILKHPDTTLEDISI